MIKHRLEVTYSGDFWPDMDVLIEKALNKESSSSGMSLGRYPQRDLCFEYATKMAAEKAAEKVKKICPSAEIVVL